jgi:hypothetical protein
MINIADTRTEEMDSSGLQQNASDKKTLDEIAYLAFSILNPESVDLKLRNEIGFPEWPMFIKRIDKIKEVILYSGRIGNANDVNNMNFSLRQRSVYESSLLQTSEVIEDSEINEQCFYDIEGRLKEQGAWSFIYPENTVKNERKRETYLAGKYVQTEVITLTNNGYQICISSSDGFKRSTNYYYDELFIIKAVEKNENENREWKWVKYYYDTMGNLEKVTIAVNNEDKISNTRLVVKNEFANILVMNVYEGSETSDSNLVFTIQFMNYDEYGNWHDQEIYDVNGNLQEKYHRVIEYNHNS